jgi:hypothetical protein
MASPAINLGGQMVRGAVSAAEALRRQKILAGQTNWLRGRDINNQAYYQDTLGNARTNYNAGRGQAWDVYGDMYRTGGFRPEEQANLDYTPEAAAGLDLTAGEREGLYLTPEEQANLYYSPEERAQIELTPERAQQMRAVSGTGISRAYQTARAEAGRTAARRGGYVPGMNATLAQMAREQGETAAETAMRNEGDIYQMGAAAADRLAAQRTGAAGKISAQRTGTLQYGSEARRAALEEAQRSRGAAARDIEAARAKAQTTAGRGFTDLATLDAAELRQLHQLRQISDSDYARLISTATEREAWAPTPSSAAVSSINPSTAAKVAGTVLGGIIGGAGAGGGGGSTGGGGTNPTGSSGPTGSATSTVTYPGLEPGGWWPGNPEDPSTWPPGPYPEPPDPFGGSPIGGGGGEEPPYRGYPGEDPYGGGEDGSQSGYSVYPQTPPPASTFYGGKIATPVAAANTSSAITPQPMPLTSWGNLYGQRRNSATGQTPANPERPGWGTMYGTRRRNTPQVVKSQGAWA